MRSGEDQLFTDPCVTAFTPTADLKGSHSVNVVVNSCALERHLNTFNSSQNVKVTVSNVRDGHPQFLGVDHPSQNYYLST